MTKQEIRDHAYRKIIGIFRSPTDESEKKILAAAEAIKASDRLEFYHVMYKMDRWELKIVLLSLLDALWWEQDDEAV